ncbi:MAG: UPF0164 family protein [Spirochaetaceae bacterium]|nr:UPF0164 family protein [Spirochaetaceae bacterium]
MKRFRLLCVALLALLPLSRGAAQLGPSIYQLVGSYFNPDPNAGLTAFRSLLIPMGGLAEGMGMAYTAVARESSYFESNPAASSGLEYTELSIFHNNWIADTRIEGAVYTLRYKGLGFGAGGKWLYLPFVSYDDFGERIGAGYYSEATAAFNVSYNFLSGYYFNGLALGATVKAAYRSVPAALAEAAGNSAAAVMVDLGLLTRFNLFKLYSAREKNFSVGLALKNFGPAVQGEPLPTVANFGLAYAPFRPMLFSLEIAKPINLLEPAKSERFIYSAGFRIKLTDFFGVHGGLLLKGGNPRLSVGSTFDIELVRLTVNYTLDLTTQLTPLNRISIQAGFSLGDFGRAELAKKVETLYLNGLDSYAGGDVAAAILDWTEALRLDPSFDPARESLRAAQGSVDLQKSIEVLQRLEP